VLEPSKSKWPQKGPQLLRPVGEEDRGWTLETTHEFERRMSRLLFESGFWDIREARLIEEDVFFACHHHFRRISYHVYPAMYTEHLRRYRFLFPDVTATASDYASGSLAAAPSSSSNPQSPSSDEVPFIKVGAILMSYQEDLLERPDAAVRAVKRHLGMPLTGENGDKGAGGNSQERRRDRDEGGGSDSSRRRRPARGGGRREGQRGSGGGGGGGVRFAGGRRIDDEHASRPRESSGAEMAAARCRQSSVDPRDLLRFFQPSMAEFYDLVGRNYSWETAALPPPGEEGVSAVTCRDWRVEGEA
jgi:hypothetical protein